MPQLYLDDLSDLLNAASILNAGNAGHAIGSSTGMTLRNDRFSLIVTGTGLVAAEEAGRFAGFTAGRITGLEFGLIAGDASAVQARIEGIDLAAPSLSRAGLDSLLSASNWNIRPLGREDLALYLYATVVSGEATIHGSTGDDWIESNIRPDLILAKAGADYLQLWGNDTAHGGAGNDVIRLGGDPAEAPNAVAYGGDGADQILDVSLAYGGAGADSLWSETGRLYGGDGADGLSLLAGKAYGGAGNDGLSGGAAALLYGGDGNDRIKAAVGGTVYGGDGDDRMILANAPIPENAVSRFYGGAGNDVFRPESNRYGSATQDRAEGGAGMDTLYGHYGADTLTGGDGDDALYGGADDDRLSGGAGHDVMAGDAGQDNLFAGTGDDALTGGAGNDTLSGGIGNDTLTGDAGNDDLRGGEGSDLFVFGADNGQDRILDFVSGLDGLQLDVAFDAATTAKGVILTSREDPADQILVLDATRNDLEGIDNLFFV